MTGHPAPVVTWRKLSGQVPKGRVRYNNSALQILHVYKSDSDAYFCSAANLLGRVEKKTLLVVVSLPRFTIKPPPKIVAYSGCGLTLSINCSATGDPQPVITWRRIGGQLPVERSQKINGALVIRDLQTSDAGNYVCVATSAGVFNMETASFIEVKNSKLVLSVSLYIIRKCFFFYDKQNADQMSTKLNVSKLQNHDSKLCRACTFYKHLIE